MARATLQSLTIIQHAHVSHSGHHLQRMSSLLPYFRLRSEGDHHSGLEIRDARRLASDLAEELVQVLLQFIPAYVPSHAHLRTHLGTVAKPSSLLAAVQPLAFP